MENFIVNLLAVMVLINFVLNLTSVYLGRYKKHLLEDYLQHILEHICPAYEDIERHIERDDEDTLSELAIKLSKDKVQFDEWDQGVE